MKLYHRIGRALGGYKYTGIDIKARRGEIFVHPSSIGINFMRANLNTWRNRI